MESTPRAPMSWNKRDDRDTRDPPDDRDRSHWRPRSEQSNRGAGSSRNDKSIRGGRGGRGGGSRNNSSRGGGFRDDHFGGSRDAPPPPPPREHGDTYRDDGPDLFSDGAWSGGRSTWQDPPLRKDSYSGDKPWDRLSSRYDNRPDDTPPRQQRSTGGRRPGADNKDWPDRSRGDRSWQNSSSNAPWQQNKGRDDRRDGSSYRPDSDRYDRDRDIRDRDNRGRDSGDGRGNRENRDRETTPLYRDRRVSGPPPSLPSTPSRASSTGPVPPSSAPRPGQRRPLPDQVTFASQSDSGPTSSAKRKRKKAGASTTALTDSNIHNPNNPNYIGYTKKEARERERKKQETEELDPSRSGSVGDISLDSSSLGNGGGASSEASVASRDGSRDGRKRLNPTFSDSSESRSRSDFQNKRPKREASTGPQFDDDVPCYGDDEPGEPVVATTPVDTTKPRVTQHTLTSSIFERVTQVGEGTYGKVYKAVNQVSGTTSALKRLRLETEREGFPVTALREIKLLQSLRHDNIISLKEMMVEENGVFMIFGYMSHDLSGILAQPNVRLEEGHIKFLFHQILSGLTYIHQRGILHRDIKGSNILVDGDGNLKLADFGLSRTIDPSNKRARYSNRVITLWYRPPELLFGATLYDGAVDNWGAGCLLVELYSRLAVFRGADEINQLDCIFDIMGTPTNEYWPDLESLPWFEMLKFNYKKPSKFLQMYDQVCSKPALKLASKLLEMNPAYRMTSQEAMNSDYFNVEPKAERPLVLRELVGEWHEFDAKKLRRAKRKEEDLRRGKERRERKEAEARAKAEGRPEEKPEGLAAGGGLAVGTSGQEKVTAENTTEANAEPPSAPGSSREPTCTTAPPSVHPSTTDTDTA
ncbi:YALIA101S01e01112g1_1 [Yarrowia lipolytica]|nr:CTD kinase subunit alpha [Yarrowia lipolytica]SEI30517.1 YALIA101S01e01112g1_1 [Yarrowia lipolytica]